jgi:hypothetical protein
MDENKRVFYSFFELDLEPGLGTKGDLAFFSMEETATPASFTVSFTVEETEGGIIGESWTYSMTPTVVGGIAPYTYSWDMGDGNPPNVNELPTQVWARNGFSNPDTITVTLTVTDDTAATAVKTAGVHVIFNE